MAEHSPEQIVLPERIVSSIDLSRLIRELTALDESIRQISLRAPGEPTKLAATGATLEEFASLNKIQLTDEKQRGQFLELVKGLQIHAPRIHMSLAAEPTAKFTQKIAIWMRKNIHPLVLLEVGLQPNLAAGCMVRTDNKLFDMSLRHCFTENRPLLVQKIAEIGRRNEPAAAAAPVSVPDPVLAALETPTAASAAVQPPAENPAAETPPAAPGGPA